MSLLNFPSQLTCPETLTKLDGTGTITPERKTSSSPLIGVVVIQALLAESNAVEVQVAFGSKVIRALGTHTL